MKGERGPIVSLVWHEKGILVAGGLLPLVLNWILFGFLERSLTPNLLDAKGVIGLLTTYLVSGIIQLWLIDSRLVPYKKVVEDLYDYHNKQIDPALQKAAAEYLEKYTTRLINAVCPTINTRIHALWEIEFLRNIATIDMDARNAVRRRVESLCNKLAGSGQIKFYFATENLSPHLLQDDHDRWWEDHGKALTENGISKRQRLLVLSYGAFLKELSEHNADFGLYIEKNKTHATDFKILVYRSATDLAFFDGVLSWNYAIYGGDDAQGGGKVFVHHLENTIEILSGEEARPYFSPRKKSWNGDNCKRIACGLFVSGKIDSEQQLQTFSGFLSEQTELKSPSVPCQGAVPPSSVDCWAHHLVGSVPCHRSRIATPGMGGRP